MNHGEINDATELMLELVDKWIWYGFHSPDELDEQIDLDSDDEVEVVRVKAYAADMLRRKRAAEATWPAQTDCDRLDRAFARLAQQGFCVLQFPDSGYTLAHGEEAVVERLTADGQRPDRYTAYCFYHAQDIDSAREGEGLMLAFGSTQSEDIADFVRAGRLVCQALEQEDLKADWDGTANRRIHIPGFRWQRRTPA